VIICGREICAICQINGVMLRNSNIANFLVEKKVKIPWTWTSDPRSQQIDHVSSRRPAYNQDVTVTQTDRKCSPDIRTWKMSLSFTYVYYLSLIHSRWKRITEFCEQTAPCAQNKMCVDMALISLRTLYMCFWTVAEKHKEKANWTWVIMFQGGRGYHGVVWLLYSEQSDISCL